MKNSYISGFENNGKYRLTKFHILSFSALLISLLLCLELLNRHFVCIYSRDYQKLCSFDSQKKDVETIFVGDSHFNNGIAPKLFKYKTYNLSFGGTNYIQSYYLLKNNIDELDSLKLVVLPLDLHSFSSFRSDRISFSVLWNKYINYYELMKIKGPTILKYKYYLTLTDRGTGKIQFFYNLKKFILDKLKHSEPISRPKKKTAGKSLSKNDTIKRVQFQLEDKNVFDKDLILYFEKLLNLCKEKNVAVVTLQMPFHADYLEYANQYVTDSQIRKHILQDLHFDQLIYKNLNYTYFAPEKDELFRNGDHLSRTGKKLFTEHLCVDIDNIIMQLQPTQ